MRKDVLCSFQCLLLLKSFILFYYFVMNNLHNYTATPPPQNSLFSTTIPFVNEHTAHFHVWFHMFHINYRQSQRIVHGGAQCDFIRNNHTVITDVSRSSAHVISCALGGLLIIKGTHVDCPVRVSCEWNHRWPPTAHTWWDLDFDSAPLPAVEHIILLVCPIMPSMQNLRHNSYIPKLK